jgi:predicted phage terminase large subunit-like protein
MRELRAQAGPQTKFLSTTADICIFGGAAGGGKTFALLLEPLRYINQQGFNGVIFRKNYTQVTDPGGLWETSLKMYSGIRGAMPWKSPKKHWDFGGRSTLSFDYLSNDDDVFSWQGSQICFIGWDELTHFTENMFFYMLSRNRSTCGVKPYVRATCNPDSDSWVKEFISWWIDQRTGYAIPERSGVLRWFFRAEDGGVICWGDSPGEVCQAINSGLPMAEHITPDDCKSVTFITSSVYDNKALLEANPTYLSSLKALSLVNKERLLRGNWKIRPAAGLYFKREQFRIVKNVPAKIVVVARAWDLAATEITTENKDPDRTAGVLIARLANGQYIVLNAIRRACNAANVRQLVKSTGLSDRAEYKCNTIHIPQDPGQAGKEQAASYTRFLAGFTVKTHVVSGSKINRAEPFSAQVQAGNVMVLEGPWNDVYLSELESFPDGAHDDLVDASSDAFAAVAAVHDWSALIS